MFGVLRRLWASLIKECAGAELLFLRSNFKVRVMEGLFGPGNVSVSAQTLTRLMMDKTARRDAAGMIFFLFFGAVERWEWNKERALMRRRVTLETLSDSL